MRNRKRVLTLYQIFENDSLRDYLEDMAKQGWKLTSVTNMLLGFEACEPHPIRYCVEVMDKPSVYTSIQALPLKKYREFCSDAGWEYIGANGYLHIFCTEDMDAIPVETDAEERFDRICRASAGGNRIILIFFFLISLLNLFICFQKKTLLCPQGLIVLILLCVVFYYGGEFFLWKKQAERSLSLSGDLPCARWQTVQLRNNISFSLILLICIFYLIYVSLDAVTDAAPIMLISLPVYLSIYGLMLFFFGRLIHWLREKKSFGRITNILIYWGIGLGATILIMAAMVVLLTHFL